MYKLQCWFLKWLIDWASLIESIIGILSLGFINVQFGLDMAVIYTKFRYYREENKND